MKEQEMGLPEGWKIVKLSDVCTKGKQRKPEEGEIFHYIDIGSIDRNLKRIDSPEKIRGVNAPSRARKIINEGDVLVSLTRPNLNAVALVTKQYDNQIASTGFEVLKPKNIDSQLLYFLVRTQHFINAISSLEQGALYPAAKSSDVQNYKFPLPPLPEQQHLSQKLTALLDGVAEAKQRLENIPALLKQFRQSVLADAVSGKLTEEWRKENDISFSSWIETNVGNVAKVETGKTPSRKNSDYWENGKIPWLTSSCTNLPYIEKADEFVTDLAVKECSLKIFTPNTLLLAMYGEGKTRGQVTEIKLPASCNQACAAITANNALINNQYLKFNLLKNYDEIRKSAAGGNQPNLNLSKVKEIKINLPSLPEQTQIIQKVETYFALADKIENYYCYLRCTCEYF